MDRIFLGVDIGSTTMKAALLTDDCKVLHSLYQRTQPSKDKLSSCGGKCFVCGVCNMGALKNTIAKFLSEANVESKDIVCTVVTGSQIIEGTGDFIEYDLKVSEVSAHVAGATQLYPDCKAILDVGGQDSKAMMYNEKMHMWTSKMSGICAAGTGAFLDSVALKLGVPIEKMAEIANLDSSLEFSSVCAVLSATSINKFKNRYPIDEIIGGACKAQARTIMSGIGDLFFKYQGDIIFQGGVATNHAVRYYLEQITGNRIIVPAYNSVMGAFGAACLGRNHTDIKNKLKPNKVEYIKTQLKSVALRTKHTRKDFFGKNNNNIVWRNLFFPTEILNAFDAKIFTLETYAALFARNRNKIKNAFDVAAYKGFTGAETCSFLRTLEGIDIPKPAFGVSTSQPCLQAERIFRDLIRNNTVGDKFYSLHTPVKHDKNAVEHLAADLEYAVSLLEKALRKKLDIGRLEEACEYSNQAQELSTKCNNLRHNSPPLLRGSTAVYFAAMFSQLWGRKELIDIQKQFYLELLERRDKIEGKISIEDTHRALWLHLPPFYDSKLLDYIELTCNIPIVFEEVNYTVWDKLKPKDPYRSLAKKLLTVGFLDPQVRVDGIKKHVALGKFNGCILYNHMFGRCAMSDASFIKHLKEELNKALVPLLVLDGDCMDPTIDPCSTYTKINAYSEALNTRKYGNIFGPTK
jgi:predicted CoA-substrate-specific enzyme activase